MNAVEMIGMVGIALSATAYVPQVVHLGREHCSAGISINTWGMWLVSGLLISLVAFQRGDPVFIVLQLTNLVSAAVIMFLAWKYKGRACETHADHRMTSGRDSGTVTS